MANEITGNLYTQLSNGGLTDSPPTAQIAITQTTALAEMLTPTVTTAEGDITFASVTTNGWVRMKNLDGTNFVKFGPKSGGNMVVFGKLKAGEVAWFRMMTGVTLRMIADTASCKVEIRHYND